MIHCAKSKITDFMRVLLLYNYYKNCFLYFYTISMKKIDLRSSKRIIVSCTSFESKKDSSTWFRLKYIQTTFDENHKSSTWKLIPQDEIKNLSVSKVSLGAEFEKMSDDEICQELQGKSILMTTSLGD